jgi:serine/threonine protein kinase
MTMYQGDWILMNILRGLAHIHECGYIHRDIKPANILLSPDSVCIADFGHATTCPPRSEVVTIQTNPEQSDRVFTRWYRSPEVTLLLPYNESADMFAVGCVYVEIVRHALGEVPHPLFHESLASFPISGDITDEGQHIHMIYRMLGTPSKEERAKLTRPDVGRVMDHAALLAYADALPHYERRELGFPALQTAWVYAMLAYDPALRITAVPMLEWVEDA